MVGAMMLQRGRGVISADAATENGRAGTLYSFMNVNLTPGPNMPPIENLANFGPVGVPSPCCTMADARTGHLTAGHLITSTSAGRFSQRHETGGRST